MLKSKAHVKVAAQTKMKKQIYLSEKGKENKRGNTSLQRQNNHQLKAEAGSIGFLLNKSICATRTGEKVVKAQNTKKNKCMSSVRNSMERPWGEKRILKLRDKMLKH